MRGNTGPPQRAGTMDSALGRFGGGGSGGGRGCRGAGAVLSAAPGAAGVARGRRAHPPRPPGVRLRGSAHPALAPARTRSGQAAGDPVGLAERSPPRRVSLLPCPIVSISTRNAFPSTPFMSLLAGVVPQSPDLNIAPVQTQNRLEGVTWSVQQARE